MHFRILIENAIGHCLQSFGNRNITPMHLSAINPNSDYLAKLISVDPDFNTPDTAGWRPVHYAAVCQGPAPLKLLIGKGVALTDANKTG